MIRSESFDWGRGTWGDNSRADATICFAGDWAPIRAFQPIIESDPEAIYGDLLPMIRDCDLRVVNLEAPLSDRGTPACKSGAVFKGERKHVQGLAPFDVACLANNHMFDFGPKGFADTIEVLGEAGIRHLGAGGNSEAAIRPLKIEVNGISVGLVNFSEGEDLTAADDGPGVMGWDLGRVKQAVAELRPTVDFLVVISHCGIEYIPFPPPYVANAFKTLAGAGADLVIGHHPHVPQGISFPNGVPVCHSLGNFVFYQETDLKFRKLGYMVKLGLTKSGPASLEVVPYQILPQGLTLLKGEAKEVFFEKFKEISLPLHHSETLDQSWGGFLDHYGQKGFANEITGILGKLDTDPPKGAAMFRNRLTTLQHFHHFKDLMTRIMANEMGTSPAWARDLAAQWLTTRLDSIK